MQQDRTSVNTASQFKGRPFDTWDAIKLVGLLLMFCDHTGWFILHNTLWLRAIGRGAPPIFFFLTGFAPSWRWRWDIFVLAVLLTASNAITQTGWQPTNILFTILLCRVLFRWLDRSGRTIDKPWEWLIGCLFLWFTYWIGYGTFGLLFAIFGYMQRRKADYPRHLRLQFGVTSFVAYGAFTAVLGGYSWADAAVMEATLLFVLLLLFRFSVRPLRTQNVPPWLVTTGLLLSRYSAYVYAFHLLALEWATGLAV